MLVGPMLVGSLRERAADAVEIMDGPDADPEMLDRTYGYFRYVNAVVSGWRQMYRRDIRPLLSTGQTRTLLDIGSGGGDLARSLHSWAGRDGFRLSVTGIDPDARAHGYVTGLPTLPGLTFRRALSAQLVEEGAQFDFVVSNHVLHHLDAGSLGALLFDSERLCRGRVLHADIERSTVGYLGFGAGTWPFFRDSYIRDDGLTSIRRSFTAAELQAALDVAGLGPDRRDAPGWGLTREIPSRLVLRWAAPRA